MSRQRNRSIEKCLVCGKRCPNKLMPVSNGWDWLQGHLPEMAHFCPEHKKGELRDRLVMIGTKKPETWTADERKFVASFVNEINCMRGDTR